MVFMIFVLALDSVYFVLHPHFHKLQPYKNRAASKRPPVKDGSFCHVDGGHWEFLLSGEVWEYFHFD